MMISPSSRISSSIRRAEAMDKVRSLQFGPGETRRHRWAAYRRYRYPAMSYLPLQARQLYCKVELMADDV